MLIKLSGMICIFIVGISQKRESVILILILFGTYDMYIMVYKSSNYKQWSGVDFTKGFKTWHKFSTEIRFMLIPIIVLFIAHEFITGKF